MPALRSTRVPPIAALQASTPPASRRRRLLYAALSVLLGLAGLAMVLVGLFGGAERRRRRRPDGRRRGRDRPRRLALQPAPGAAAGVDRRLAAGALRRLTGRLARENTQRNPSRTAVTAAALMIGLALVAFVTVFAAGMKSSIAQVVDENFEGELVIQNTDGFSPIPAGAAVAARQVPGVELVSTMRATQAKLLGSGRQGARLRARRRTPARRSTIDWKRGRAGDAAQPRATARRSSPTPSPPTTTSRSATASAC